MAGVCGRDCGSCELRADYGCGGCLETEGHPFWGECRVVSCCHGRGLQNCGECPSADNCGAAQEMRWQRERWPGDEAERQRQEAERQALRREEMARKAPILGKWLLVLFWLHIGSLVLNLVERITTGGSGNLLTNAISLVISLITLFIYWKFSKLSDHFKRVWWIEIAALALLVVVTLLLLVTKDPENLLVPMFLLLIVAVVLGVATIYECSEAMAEQLDGEDQHLADNWRLLRKWTLGTMGAMLGCVVLALIIPTLAMLLALGAALVLVGCTIAQEVLIWQSARFFREQAALTALPPAEV